MKLRSLLVTTAVLTTLGISAAIAQMQGMDMQKMMQMMMPKSDDSASTKDFKQSHMEMMTNMNMEFTGDADIDFARSMAKHHASGITMAKVELKHDKNPEMRKMAETVIKGQEKEIAEFNAWLKKNAK